MTTESDLDRTRRAALDQVSRARAHLRNWMIAVALWEAVWLLIVVLFMDWGDRLHILGLLLALLVYGTLGIGLMTLGAYIRENTLRVLTAIELLDAGP